MYSWYTATAQMLPHACTLCVNEQTYSEIFAYSANPRGSVWIDFIGQR